MILAGTGHRPDKLGGYSRTVERRLVTLAAQVIAAMRPTPITVISGMALGWDQAVAEAALYMGIPLVAAIPFEGQQSRWNTTLQKRWRELLDQADKVVIVSPGPYSNEALQSRNEWMVDRCDQLLAMWDGSDGGTANCLRYAKLVGKPHTNVWAQWAGVLN